MVEAVAGLGIIAFGCVFGLVFTLMRLRYRQRLRARQDPGFYPSTRELGNAFENLQMFAQPRIAYVQDAKEKDPRDEDNNGDGSPKGAAD